MHVQDQLPGRDHQSDPAHTPGDGWADEGGASHLGPATHLDIDREHDADRGETSAGSGGSDDES